MMKHKKSVLMIAVSLLLIPTLMLVPIRASGKVKQISEMEDKLEGISEEERTVLVELFHITQETEKIEREEAIIIKDIASQKIKMKELEVGIEEKQQDYDLQLGILEQVLVNYQRGGPASYLEILLGAEDFTTFLKSINIIKDISRNVGELLDSLAAGKIALEEEKDTLSANAILLEAKKAELQKNLLENQQLQQEKEQYLSSLQENRVYYEEQLDNLEATWTNCKMLFTGIVGEITRIVGEGYFTIEDLNLSLGFTKTQGAIIEDNFNQILKEHSTLPETRFHFKDNQVIIEVPEKHLVLTGNFILSGETAIEYVVEKGTFYELPLEAVSLEELFQEGPLLLDFKTIIGDMLLIDFTLNQVQSQEQKLAFEIKPVW